MRLAAVTALALLCLLPGAAQAAELLPGGDFESGLQAWQLQADNGATAGLAGDKPAGGKSALQLQTTGKTGVWALSPALQARAGEVVQVAFSARRLQGQATLLCDLVNSAAELGELGLWEARLPADAAWHRVSLLVKLPPVGGDGALHLAFGVSGLGGAWQLDEVSVQPGTAPAYGSADNSGEKPQTASLPPDWKPEGLLDARSREAGGAELIVNVNGVELGVRPDFTCYRGFREGMMVYAVNRGELEKQVRVEVAAAAPGVDAPAWLVPIGPGGMTRFHLAAQALRQGEGWLKLTFSSGGQSASLPVKLTCRRSYPVLGVTWQAAVPEAQLRAVAAVPLDLQVLAAPPDAGALLPMLEPVRRSGCEYLAAPTIGSLTGPQYVGAVGQLLDQLQPSFWLPYCESDPATAFMAAPGLVGAVRKKQLRTGVLTPPLQLARDFTKEALLPSRSALLTPDRAAALLAVACRLPRQRAACVLSEQVDDKRDVPGGAALAQARQSDLTGLRTLLNERGLRLPVLVDRLQGRRGGDERLEALALARALVSCFSVGSTGVLLDPTAGPDNAYGVLAGETLQPEAPVPTVLRCLQQELASATPLMALTNSAEISTGAQTPVTYHPFLRGGEGIVVLWNNTSAPQDVTLEFRSQPVVSRLLTLSYSGEFAVTRWQPIMKFSEEAYKRGLPCVYLRLEPLGMQVHSFRLLDPHAAWLRNVSLTVPYVPPKAGPTVGPEDRSWWKDMLGGRKPVQ